MDDSAPLLQAIGYHAAIIYPLLPTYALLLISALLPIYTGTHASLTRPTSAAKPAKTHRNRSKHHRKSSSSSTSDDDDELEASTKMEGLGPTDAIVLPIFAGASLGGMYLLIKWLEDPALLNRILNAYFSIFGLLAMAKLGADAMSVVHDFVFPECYTVGTGKTVWRIMSSQRKVEAATDGSKRSSPLPGSFSLIPLPRSVEAGLWTLRESSRRNLHLRIYAHNLLNTSVKISPFTILSTFIAVGVALYTNLVSTPWYLNNLSAFAFVYMALQVMTPTTAWTATLILGGLFFYDIYFVFYTPVMVTVATKLDIPAKMLFPRPEGMSMLGLGDLAVPGVVIGFALRFDLWNYYFKQQSQNKKVEGEGNGRVTRSASKSATIAESGDGYGKESAVIKPKYHKATGYWGTRFWTGSNHHSLTDGTIFPKPYFQATMTGYVLGMLTTLLVMHIYGHAQPALLYLVPGVLVGLWGTAFWKSEFGVLWTYYEDVQDSSKDDDAEGKKVAAKGESGNEKRGWWSLLIHPFTRPDDSDKPKKARASENDKPEGTPKSNKTSTPHSKERAISKKKPPQDPSHDNKLISFSISFPRPSSSPKPQHRPRSNDQEKPLANHRKPYRALDDLPQDADKDADSTSSDAGTSHASRLLDKLERIGYTPPTPPTGWKGGREARNRRSEIRKGQSAVAGGDGT